MSQYRVFADYMATGIWGPNPGDTEVQVPEYVPGMLKRLLAFWVVKYSIYSNEDLHTTEIMTEFNSLGRYITKELNALQKDTFIYVES